MPLQIELPSTELPVYSSCELGSLPAYRPEISLPLQHVSLEEPDLDYLPHAERELSLKLTVDNGRDPEDDCPQINVWGTWDWKCVNSSANAAKYELTFAPKISVYPGTNHGRFKYVHLKVKLVNIPYKLADLECVPKRTLRTDKTELRKESMLGAGGQIGYNTTMAGANMSARTAQDLPHYATYECKVQGYQLVRWIIAENKALKNGVIWKSDPEWPDPSITVGIERKKVPGGAKIGYQLVCEFEPQKKSAFQFSSTKSPQCQEPDDGNYKWISLNFEPPPFSPNDTKDTASSDGDEKESVASNHARREKNKARWWQWFLWWVNRRQSGVRK